MLVIGLTGGIGSGKSTVAALFQHKGIDIVDADLIARQVVEPGEPALTHIAEHFGSSILDERGSLRRADLRKRVFAEPTERLWLERLLHPLIQARIRQRLLDCRPPYSILVSPLLLETGQKNLVDRIAVVDVSTETQLCRTLHRDGGDRATVEAIIAAQISRQARLDAADDVIDNETSMTALSRRVDELHAAYLHLAGTGQAISEKPA